MRIPFVIEYNETERIVVDHVAKTDTSVSGTSTGYILKFYNVVSVGDVGLTSSSDFSHAMLSVKKHFTNMKEAVDALKARVMVLHQFLKETREGVYVLCLDTEAYLCKELVPLCRNNSFQPPNRQEGGKCVQSTPHHRNTSIQR